MKYRKCIDCGKLWNVSCKNQADKPYRCPYCTAKRRKETRTQIILALLEGSALVFFCAVVYIGLVALA